MTVAFENYALEFPTEPPEIKQFFVVVDDECRVFFHLITIVDGR